MDGNEALRDPTRVEGELRAQGIDATIVEVPVLSNMQGRWWWIAFDDPSGLTQREFNGLYAQVGEGGPDPSIPIENSTMLELPKVQGHVTLFVGRTVPADEFRVTAYDRINESLPLGPSTAWASTRTIPLRSGVRSRPVGTDSSGVLKNPITDRM